ncbi:unnamed protein product [Hyaloperonospora brassicae]|uniref:Inner centromere protein ARK-binding domain-containing protein n=1 Tax=Hyaloperonospora brassicae TaxID=162125 RepID=A0AAV0T5L0_HYABA|nr:unnamed protein product [Hyaloperonospora brassicae]
MKSHESSMLMTTTTTTTTTDDDVRGRVHPEELLLEAYDLQWEVVELRCQRLEKTWQHFLLTEKMEREELQYNCQLRRLECEKKERKKKHKEEKKRKQEEAREKAERAREEALRCKWEKERAKVERKKKVTGRGTQTDESALKLTKKSKEKSRTNLKGLTSGATQEKQEHQKTKGKRIAPVRVRVTRPDDEEVVTEKEKKTTSAVSAYDSPPPELPDNGLLNLLSMLKDSSDSDVDNEPSTMSLILPGVQDVAEPPLPMKTKVPTAQKKVMKKKRSPPLDFNFTKAEAKRQAEVDAAARDEQDDEDGEPEAEPVPAPPVVPVKKRLKRRKEVAKDRQKANCTEPGDDSARTAATKIAIAAIPEKGAASVETTAGSVRKTTIGNGKVVRDRVTNSKSKNAPLVAEVEECVVGPLQKRKTAGKTEMMSIKDRLANAELLAQMSKRQDISTPKVLGKNMKNAQKQGAAKSLAAKKQAEMGEALSDDTADADVPRSDQIIAEEDLNISLNSSGLMSDNDSPENLRAPTRKRQREAKQVDVTPTKKLQFLEITKRLAKSPMPRLLRTPTPLMSPVGPSVLMKPKAVSPGPRTASARNASTRNEGARRMNSAPVGPKRASNANHFGVPNRFAGGAGVAAGVGSFSMFDAFVNSGSNGSIPRLKLKTRGGVSPSL